MTENSGDRRGRGSGVCSASHAPFLVTGLRRLFNDPRKILRGLISEGQTIADLGCGPGYFTLPMAEMVGDAGCVVAVDLQEAMLEMLLERARAAGLQSRIRFHKCEADQIGLDEQMDFALAFYMVHEVPDACTFLRQVCEIVKPGGQFLIVEPKFHVSAPAFERTVELAKSAGFEPVARPRITLSRSVLFRRDAT